MADDLVVVARVARTRGLRGEVVADLSTDFPERFDDLDSVIGIAPDGSRRSLQIEEHWFHQHRIILKFASFDSIDEARVLAGYQLAVPASEFFLDLHRTFHGLHWTLEDRQYAVARRIDHTALVPVSGCVRTKGCTVGGFFDSS